MKYKKIKKLYYSISEISDMLEIKASAIRYWEKEFKDLNPQRNRAGNRLYKEADIDMILLINHYVHGRSLSIQDADELIQSLKKEKFYDRKVKELREALMEETPESDSVRDKKEDEILPPAIEVENLDKNEEIDEIKADINPDEGIDSILELDEPLDKTQDNGQQGTDEETEEDKKANQVSLEFEIVPPTKETFIYPLDDQDEDENDMSEAEDLAITLDTNPIPQPILQPKPQPESESLPEVKELLKKISKNINDIIAILNE
ncbi:MAG: MerR family transcriptional regulator [Candidatus Neomarinimicrobiota bacterium]